MEFNVPEMDFYNIVNLARNFSPEWEYQFLLYDDVRDAILIYNIFDIMNTKIGENSILIQWDGMVS